MTTGSLAADVICPEIVRGSLITRILREIDHVDVLVVADPSKALPVQMEE